MEKTIPRNRATQALRNSEERFRLMVEGSEQVFFFMHDREHRFRYLSPSVQRVLGYTPEELAGQRYNILLSEDPINAAVDERTDAALRSGERSPPYLARVRHRDGRRITLELVETPVMRDGRIVGLQGFARDVSERERTALRLQESEERYRSLVEQVREVIFQTDNEGRWTFLNPAWTELTGLSHAESLGRNWLRFVHPEDQERARTEMLDLMERANGALRAEVRYRTRAGEVRWIEVHAQRTATGTAGMLYDITERRQAEEKLRRSAFYDSLTGLPNRALFTERLGHTLGWLQRHPQQQAAVLFLDVDRFKLVNDSLGHIMGDRLLVDMARRLECAVRPGDTVARLSGDEFAVLLEEVSDPTDATHVAQAIHAELAQPFLVETQEVFASASIGIALSSGGNYTRPEDLLRDADTAMYRAKAQGRGRYQVFDAEMHAHVVALLQMEMHLRRALERDEMRVSYQPVIESRSGRIMGFEALVRWQHPERGLIAPAAFVPIAEETGVILQLDRWVLGEACRTLREWQERFPAEPPLFVSVNLSGRQLADPQLPEVIAGVLRETRLDPRSLRLEITETTIIENPEAAAVVIAKLRALKVEMYIDDFGTGYSGLLFLHRFQFDSLKIDRSFVARVTTDGQKREIVRAVTSLAHNLGMRVVAEGIETVEQRQIMEEMKCEQMQGYLFSAPLEVGAVEALLLRRAGEVD